MWTGRFEGQRGYKVWRLSSSRLIGGASSPAARYHRSGVFELLYKAKGTGTDRRTVANNLNGILGHKGKYLSFATEDAGSTTIEFYCKLPSIPKPETMGKIEDYLKGNLFS